jgi:hypothetical protein
VSRCGVFVNNRHDDTGWAANAVAEALRRRLGRSSDVFIDNQSIGPGQPFAQVMEDGVRRSEVLLALIGQRWTEPPFIDRLFRADDWVRREILIAKNQQATVVPVLVDRENLSSTAALPNELQFLTGLQALKIRQANPEDVDGLANKIAALVPPGCHRTTVRAGIGVENTRAAVENLLKRTLPPAEQWSGNRDRLIDLALALLGRDDRLVYLVPARLKGRPRGSATMLLTESDIVVAQVDETFRIIGEIRFPRDYVRRVEVVPTLPLFADVIVHPTAGDPVQLLGLFRDQARRLADHLRS